MVAQLVDGALPGDTALVGKVVQVVENTGQTLIDVGQGKGYLIDGLTAAPGDVVQLALNGTGGIGSGAESTLVGVSLLSGSQSSAELISAGLASNTSSDSSLIGASLLSGQQNTGQLLTLGVASGDQPLTLNTPLGGTGDSSTGVVGGIVGGVVGTVQDTISGVTAVAQPAPSGGTPTPDSGNLLGGTGGAVGGLVGGVTGLLGGLGGRR
ncbi:MAG TPA: hypothetical protein VGE05_09095 [Novosphingobium sp.]